jgi:hypothetical protein
MSRKSTSVELEERIIELESRYRNQVVHIKSSITNLKEQLTPSHIIESGVQNVVHSKTIRKKALLSTLGIGAGVLAKKIFINKSRNPLMRIAGVGLQFLVSRFIARRFKGKNTWRS